MNDASTAPRDNRLPPQTLFIVGNEACERFSYYGMRAILMTYLVHALMIDKTHATEIVHLFICLAYVTPLVGGWIADRWLGRYNTILYVSLLYCIGNFTLAFTAFDPAHAGDAKPQFYNEMGMYIGLLLVALGSGGIKPCVSAFVGDQFGSKQKHLLQKIYGLFYWSINFGSFFAFALIPSIRDNFGIQVAFAVPGAFMALSIIVFWLGRKYYVMVPPSRIDSARPKNGILRIWWYALSHQRERKPGQSRFDVALNAFSADEVAGAKAVAGILMIFAGAPFFWALYDQTCSTWVVQGKQMEVWQACHFQMNNPDGLLGILAKCFFTVDKVGDPSGHSLCFMLDADRMQSFNPLLVMLLIPVFSLWFLPLIERLGLRCTPLRRMATGMVLTALSFVAVGMTQQHIDASLSSGERLSILWQMVPYVLLTLGEILFSVTGLEFAFSQAPPTMKSTIISFWLVCVAIGNLFVSAVVGSVITSVTTWLNTHLGTATDATVKISSDAIPAMQFFAFAGLMFIVSALFIWCATRYKEQRFSNS